MEVSIIEQVNAKAVEIVRGQLELKEISKMNERDNAGKLRSGRIGHWEIKEIAEAEQRIRGSMESRNSSLEDLRLAVQGYLLRQIESLRGDVSVLRDLEGDKLFEKLAELNETPGLWKIVEDY